MKHLLSLAASTASASEYARKASVAANTASDAACAAAKVASDAACAAAKAAADVHAAADAYSAADESSSSSDDSPPEPATLVAHGEHGKALGAADVMKLVGCLCTKREGDRLRVGHALRDNERLLRASGRAPEADLMATFFDAFSMRFPENYRGRQAVLDEFARLRPGSTAITADSLVRWPTRMAAALQPA